MAIACVDVAYGKRGQARAACVVIDAWDCTLPRASYVHDMADVREPYEPGFFHRRELPCLVSVLRLMAPLAEIVVIDGYVWLPPDARPGLGARLYEALLQRASVVGIAKTAFALTEACPVIVPVLRGASRNPLFVSAIGMPVDEAAAAVRSMAGAHRMPTVVRMTDRLSREEVNARSARR